MKKKRFGVIGIALAILFLLGAAPSVLAAGLPSVAIPVKVEVEGAAPSVPEEFVVQMEAEDPSYPMPEGSVDGIFEMVILSLFPPCPTRSRAFILIPSSR